MTSRRTLLRAAVGAASLSALTTGTPWAAAGTRWDQLARHLHGRLVLPGDQGYPTAKLLDFEQFDDVDPAAVAYCADAADAATCLAFAQDNRLPFAVRSGGHSFGGYSTSKGLIIDTSGLNRVDAAPDGAVTIGAGIQAVDLVNALSRSGLAASVGECPSVAAAGFVQGGGIGFLGRTTGLACDAVTAANVVLADGRQVTASSRHNPDLYWALRGGGGGNFGVVTSFTIRPAVIDVLNTATLTWNFSAATDFLDGYAHWLVDAPNTIGAAAIIVLGDSAPGNVPYLEIEIVSSGSAAGLRNEVSRLVSMTGPAASETFASTTYRDFAMSNFGCSDLSVAQCHRVDTSSAGQLPRDGYGLVRGRMIACPPSRDGWEQVVEVFNAARTAGEVHKLELLALGGAVDDLGPTDTAYVHRGSLLDVNFLSFDYTAPALQPPGRRWVDYGFAAIDPLSDGQTYLNFTDPSLPNWQQAYYGENYPRLQAIKKEYDPYNAFRFAQSIGA